MIRHRALGTLGVLECLLLAGGCGLYFSRADPPSVPRPPPGALKKSRSKKVCVFSIRVNLGCVGPQRGASEVDFDRQKPYFLCLWKLLGPRWPPNGPKMAPNGPKMAQDGPKRPQDCPKGLQDSLKMAPRGLKIAPRWPQDGPRTPPSWPRMTPTWPQKG